MASVVFQELLELSLLIGGTRIEGGGTQRVQARHNLVHNFIRGSEYRTEAFVQEVSVKMS